jgi:putative ABC transport system substrate-binding protein
MRDLKRRDVVALLAGTAPFVFWPLSVAAQQTGRIPRIGYLAPHSPSAGPSVREGAFRQALRELGYVEGTNIAVEYRFAEGKFDRLAGLAAELARLEVDVIVAAVTQASLAAKQATSTIPIVFIAVSDPLGTGLVASLARPGANVTGTSAMSFEVVGKSMDLLKAAVPTVSRVAVLWNPDNAIFQAQMLREAQLAAGRLGVALPTFAARGSDDFEAAFAGMKRAQAGALLVLPDPVFLTQSNMARIADLANKGRLPAMYGARDHAAAGGLMAYATNYAVLYRRAAAYVDKILKGTKPDDLPVEQPTAFEFVINLRTAKLLGIEFPPMLLALADEVIE